MPTQRLLLSQKATTDAQGAATFTFPTPPTDLVWQGTLSCTGPPAGAVFTASVGGQQWCSWAGLSVGGPVQAWAGEAVQILATGLTPNTAFVIQWIGRSDPASVTSPGYPDAAASSAVSAQIGPTPSAVAAAVYQVGGLTYVFNNNTGAATSALLGAPGAGNVYRLHRAVVDMAATDGIILGHLTQNEYSHALGKGPDNFEGLCVSEALDWQTVGGAGEVWLYFDLIKLPTLATPVAIGVVQVVAAQASSPISATLNNVKPGNQIIALLGYGQSSGAAATIATTAGSTSAWNATIGTNFSNLSQARIWTAQAVTASATVTVTAAGAVGGGQLVLLEVAGMNGTADATSFNSGSGVSVFPSGSITPGKANDLAVVVVGTNIASMSSGPVGWIRDGTTGTGGNGALAAHILPSGSSALTPAFTGGSAGAFAIVAASFPSL